MFQVPGSRSEGFGGIKFDLKAASRQQGAAGGPGAGPSTAAVGRQQQQQQQQRERGPRDDLPVARYRRQLLYLVESHGVVIVLGETGSGKTTQIPQFLHEAGKC